MGSKGVPDWSMHDQYEIAYLVVVAEQVVVPKSHDISYKKEREVGNGFLFGFLSEERKQGKHLLPFYFIT